MKKLIKENIGTDYFNSGRALIAAHPELKYDKSTIKTIKTLVLMAKKYKFPMGFMMTTGYRDVHGYIQKNITAYVKKLEHHAPRWRFSVQDYKGRNQWQLDKYDAGIESARGPMENLPKSGYTYRSPENMLKAADEDMSLWFRRHGPINSKEINRENAQWFKRVERWKKIKARVEPRLSKFRNVTRKLGIKTRDPIMQRANKEIFWQIEEPREYRHPDEYGDDGYGDSPLQSKDYQMFQKLEDQLSTVYEKFAKKIGYKLVIAGSKSY